MLVRGVTQRYDAIALVQALGGRTFTSFQDGGLAMPERFHVRVTKDHLVFCAGHFISYEGDKCEKLHGHNYRATVEIEGELDVNRYVFDFVALKHRTKEITDQLDHVMLLATRNPLIDVQETE